MVQGGREPVSKLLFLMMGVVSVQLGEGAVLVVDWVMVFVEVKIVVGSGVVVRMQEQTLLSRDAGNAVVGGRFRFARVAVAVWVFLMRVTRCFPAFDRQFILLRCYQDSGDCGA